MQACTAMTVTSGLFTPDTVDATIARPPIEAITGIAKTVAATVYGDIHFLHTGRLVLAKTTTEASPSV